MISFSDESFKYLSPGGDWILGESRWVGSHMFSISSEFPGQGETTISFSARRAVIHPTLYHGEMYFSSPGHYYFSVALAEFIILMYVGLVSRFISRCITASCTWLRLQTTVRY